MYSSRNGRTWFFICLFFIFFGFFGTCDLSADRDRAHVSDESARARRGLWITRIGMRLMYMRLSLFFFFVFLCFWFTVRKLRQELTRRPCYCTACRHERAKKEKKQKNITSPGEIAVRRPEKLSKYIPNAQTLYIITCKTIFCNGNFLVAALQTDDTILL